MIALGLSVISVCAIHVGRHYGFIAPPAPVVVQPITLQGAPSDAALEAGLTSRTGAGQPDLLAGIPSNAPNAKALRRGTLSGGTWIPILMYHYVREAPAGDYDGLVLSVTPAEFTRQMLYLKDHGFTTLTMHDVDLVLLGKKPLPPKPVALTFDDGYTDFATTAAPVMKGLGLTATNYVPTQLLEDAAGAYMTWPDVFRLDREGFEMAAHTQFHTDLSQVDAARARIEIFGSKADLESHLGHPVYDWAYPYGGFNYTAIQLVHDAGFISAATTEAGAYHDDAQLPVLTRTRVSGGESLEDWASRLLP
ncbi:MAG: hypothetical protein QOE92_759 [Chloroflexota bacterium]|nr:hypothetical protein [Chloroflexota bacterium]